ncbi:MAG TPA: hypothetical protein VLZ83_00285 [Edaphocola sp.]|nr:hypothetical protein [Edaphocola sp.]
MLKNPIFSTIIIVCVCLLMGQKNQIYAQTNKAKVQNQTKNKIEPTPAADDNLNKSDSKNRKQGMWFYNRASQFGDPSYYEFGAYKDDMKTGLWYKLSKDQELISIENYKFNVLDGTAQYYENGKLTTIGNYRGIYTSNKYDTVLVIDPMTTEATYVVVAAEKGYTKHGLWRYYNPISGQLTMEREYQVDILLKEKKFKQLIYENEKQENKHKFPHEGGKEKGWNSGKYKTRNSLIK